VIALVVKFLIRESKGLLTGESAEPGLLRSVQWIAERDQAVASAGKPLTMVLGPCAILLAIEIQFRSQLNADELAAAVDRIEESIRARHPCVRQIFIEAESVRRGIQRAGIERSRIK